MSRVIVIGGTGYAGSNIVAEAARRGHTVIAYSRNAPEAPVAGVEYVQADVTDSAALKKATEGADVVISALSPRGDLSPSGLLRRIDSELAQIASEAGHRLGVVGGAGSLIVFEGGPALVDTEAFPESSKPEAAEMGAVLDDLRASDSTLDWFYISPAAGFGSWAPGEAIGSYRVGGEVLLADAEGGSFISGADFALAVVDEIERPAHSRERFGVAY
ncbi:NAD(P)-dependent oxidoreductase [Mesorhizobium japonicum]|uniref:NAD(P)-dependent oxidoreductase n=1 Tax=Mesorhizobium japonicum TaxID=2066070 RepID=UPI003B5C64F1